MQRNILGVVLLVITIAAFQLSLGSLRLAAQSQDPQERSRDLEALVKVYEAEIGDLKADLQQCEETTSNLREEIALMQANRELIAENEKLLTQSLAAYGKIIEIYGQGINDRDKLIAELVKSRDKSTLRKIAESIPTVASIIAIALTAD